MEHLKKFKKVFELDIEIWQIGDIKASETLCRRNICVRESADNRALLEIFKNLKKRTEKFGKATVRIIGKKPEKQTRKWLESEFGNYYKIRWFDSLTLKIHKEHEVEINIDYQKGEVEIISSQSSLENGIQILENYADTIKRHGYAVGHSIEEMYLTLAVDYLDTE